MKPSIVNWAYIGLACLLLSNILGSVSTINYIYIMSSDEDFLYSPVLLIISVVIIAVSTIAVFGLVKKNSWARIVTSSVIGVPAILLLGMLGMNIYHTSITSTPATPSNLLIVLSVFGASLLLLAYKLYTSESFKNYLSKPQSKFKE